MLKEERFLKGFFCIGYFLWGESGVTFFSNSGELLRGNMVSMESRWIF